MKLKLIFEDWQSGKSIGGTDEDEYVNLSGGVFHSGSTFTAYVEMDTDDALELRGAILRGFNPVFYAILATEAHNDTD